MAFEREASACCAACVAEGVEVSSSGCYLMWLFYRYFCKFTGIIVNWGTHSQHCAAPDVCVPRLSGTGNVGVSPRAVLLRARGGEGQAQPFPNSSHIPGAAGGAVPPLDPQQELQLLVPVPVLAKTWHYPQPQLAKLLCDLPQRDAGPLREFCAQIGFGLGFLLVFI